MDGIEYSTLVEDYIKKETEVLNALDRQSLCRALAVLEAAYREERTVYIFGNGGSSATASHFANDFNKGVSEGLEKKYRFVCLNDNISTIMAVANDIGFEEVFRYQLAGRVKEGDVVIAISGSGNSENIVRAAAYAKEMGAYVIGLTGYDGGQLYRLADLNLHAPIRDMQIAEDIHMMFDHLMMSVLRKTFLERSDLK